MRYNKHMKLYTLNQEELDAFQRIYSYAIEKHEATGCKYSGYNYDLHVKATVNVAKQYLHLIENNNRAYVLCATAMHDLMEDCRVNYNEINDMMRTVSTYSDLKQPIAFVEGFVADIVYNVTNELGRNRKERAMKTYPKIASCRYSTFVKLCDRIANMKFSYYINDEKGMFKKYKDEYSEFYKNLYNADHGFDEMWKELQALCLH